MTRRILRLCETDEAPLQATAAPAVPRILLAAELLTGFACLITRIGHQSHVGTARRIEFGH